MLHIGLIPKVIPHKLFLDKVRPRMSLAPCVDVFVEDLSMFRFFPFQSEGKPLTLWDVSFDILITSKGASTLAALIHFETLIGV